MTSKRMSFARVDSMDIDYIHRGSLDNYDDVRGLTIFLAKLPFSLDIMSVTKDLVDYTRQMKRNNNVNEEIVELVDRSQLSYAMNNKEIQNSGAAALLTNMVPLCVNNKELMYNTHEANNVFNV